MRRPRGAVDGVARIATAAGRLVGMGILLEGNRVLTCAHVVNLAVGRRKADVTPLPAGATVAVSFPFVGEELCRGRVLAWTPPGPGNPDAALIELERDAPEAAGIATLAKIPDPYWLPGELTVFGMTGDQILGGHVEVELVGEVSGGWWQLVGTRDIGAYAVKGFSGAAVWSRAERAVVGMLVAVARASDDADAAAGQAGFPAAGVFAAGVPAAGVPPPAERRTAYCQPVAALKAAIPVLPIERRAGSPATQRAFAISAILLFLAALLHLVALQSQGVRAWVPWAQGSGVLVAFFAIWIVAALAINAFWMIWKHVGRFSRSRPWETRFPSILGRYPSDSLLNTRAGTIAALVLLVAVPVWTVGSSMTEFYQKRHVILVRTIDDPDYRADPDAGLMQFAWNGSRYRIAGIGDEKNFATFFPFFEPIAAAGLALAALGLAVAINLELFLPPTMALVRFRSRRGSDMADQLDDDTQTAPDDLLGALPLSQLESDDAALPPAPPPPGPQGPGAEALAGASFTIAPAGEPQQAQTKFTATDSRTGQSFYVGRITTYQSRIGLSRRSDAVIYDRTRYAESFGLWAHFIWPSAMAESAGQEIVINAWDRAQFTWGFYQLAAHTPDDNLVLLMRRLTALPSAATFFPELGLDAEGRLTRRLDSGEVVSLEEVTEVPLGNGTEKQIVDFMNYLNPSSRRFEEAEAVTSAKFIAWAAEDPDMLKTTLDVSIGIMKDKIRRWSGSLGLLGKEPELAIWVSDIVHQGRGKKQLLEAAMAQPDFESRLDALSRIDRFGSFAERRTTVKAAVKTLMDEKRFEGVAFGSGPLAL